MLALKIDTREVEWVGGGRRDVMPDDKFPLFDQLLHVVSAFTLKFMIPISRQI